MTTQQQQTAKRQQQNGIVGKAKKMQGLFSIADPNAIKKQYPSFGWRSTYPYPATE